MIIGTVLLGVVRRRQYRLLVPVDGVHSKEVLDLVGHQIDGEIDYRMQ